MARKKYRAYHPNGEPYALVSELKVGDKVKIYYWQYYFYNDKEYVLEYDDNGRKVVKSDKIVGGFLLIEGHHDDSGQAEPFYFHIFKVS